MKTAYYQASPDVYSTTLKGKVYLLKSYKDYTEELNETAQLIWSALQKKSSLDQIVQAVVSAYDIDPEEARKDVERFLAAFVKKGFVIRHA